MTVVGNHVVVTTGTAAQYLQMINRYRRLPHTGRVAVLADVGGADVFEALTNSGNTIVAGTTGFGGARVIEGRR